MIYEAIMKSMAMKSNFHEPRDDGPRNFCFGFSLWLEKRIFFHVPPRGDATRTSPVTSLMNLSPQANFNCHKSPSSDAFSVGASSYLFISNARRSQRLLSSFRFMISKHDFASQIMASFIGWIPRGASRSLALMAGLTLMCRTFCFVPLLRLRLDGINKTSTVQF